MHADKTAAGDLYKYLRHRARKYKVRGSNDKTRSGQIKNRTSIDERPLSVDDKSVADNWEIDSVIGKSHRGALVTIVKRVTLFAISMRVESKRAKEVATATLALLMPFKGLVHTITSDNEKEFAYHEEIATRLEFYFYFAHPYHS